MGLGAGFHHQADDMVSPLRYGGVGLDLELRWGFSAPSAIRALSASYAGPRLTSSATTTGSHYEEGVRVETRLLLLQRVAASGGGRLSLLFGGALSGQFAYYDHWYSEDEKEAWLTLFGLVEPGLGWSLALPGEGRLWQEVTVPLVGLVVRPGYEGLTDTPTTEWAGVGEVAGVGQSLHYLQPVGRRLRLGLTYALRGLRYGKPRPISWMRQSLMVHVTVWGGRGR